MVKAMRYVNDDVQGIFLLQNTFRDSKFPIMPAKQIIVVR